MLPFYITKTLLFYNKTMFKEAGLAGPPQSFDEILRRREKMAKGEKTGFLTLNFDWLYWPLFEMNGVELLSPDLKKAAFNTPKAVEVAGQARRRRPRAAPSTRSPGPAAGSSPTAPSPPAMSACCTPIRRPTSSSRARGHGSTPTRSAPRRCPGDWSTPNSHGLGISKGSKNPELAWDFLKYMTDDKWASEFVRSRKLLTGNIAVDKAAARARCRRTIRSPQGAADAARAHRQDDRQLAAANDAQLKDAFWPEFQNAVLGRKDAKTALADAERMVNRVLQRVS